MRKILVGLVSIGILSYLTINAFSSQGKKLGRNRFEPGAVHQISAGDNVVISPTSGLGNVTINSTGAVILTANNTNYVNLSGSTQTKTGGFVVMGSMTVQGTGINLLNGEYRGDGSKLTNTVSLYNEGSFVARVSTVDCVGANINCTASGQTGTLTISGGSGGGGGISTFTLTRMSGGDAVLSTTPFTAIPGMSFKTGKSTWTPISISAFCTNVSTVGSTFFQIARTTGADARSAAQFTYMTHHVVVPTNTFTSSWDTLGAGTVFWSTETYSIHVTSIPQVGTLPSEFGMQIRFWVGDGTER